MGKKRKGRRKSGGDAGSGRPRATTSKAGPPPRRRLLKGKTIRVGHVEELPDGRELRCIIDGDRVVVAVFDGDERCEPSLSCPVSAAADGGGIDEGELSRVLDSYYVFSPWHDGEYTCLVLTVDCLRRGTEHELLVFKDL